jgi:hypothetical protein
LTLLANKDPKTFRSHVKRQYTPRNKDTRLPTQAYLFNHFNTLYGTMNNTTSQNTTYIHDSTQKNEQNNNQESQLNAPHLQPLNYKKAVLQKTVVKAQDQINYQQNCLR